jgi:hypothetical protein
MRSHASFRRYTDGVAPCGLYPGQYLIVPPQTHQQRATTLRLLRYYRHRDTPRAEAQRYTLVLTRDMPWTVADEVLMRDAGAMAHAPGQRLITLVFGAYSVVVLLVGVALGVALLHWVG